MTSRVMPRALSSTRPASASAPSSDRGPAIDRGLHPSLLASLLVHGALLLGAARVAIGSPPPAAPPDPAEVTQPDVWAGDTSLPGRGGLYDVDLDRAAGAAGADAPPAAAPPASPAPPATTAAATSSPRPDKTATAAASATAEPRPRTPSPKQPASSDARWPDAKARPAPGAAAASPSADGDSPGGGSFGAVDKPGIRDLGRAFARALPFASQSDEAWGRLPLGSAGKIEVTIEVDPTGKIGGFQPAERDPPKHLVQMVKRTLAHLEAGTFALRGQVGAGSEVLELTASVIDDGSVEDEPTSDTLGFEFDGKKGKGWFRHKSGKRVVVQVRVVRVDRAP